MFILVKIPRRTLAAVIVILLIGLGILGGGLTSGLYTSGVQPLEQVPTEQKAIALTFNVDWGEEQLPGILKALEQYNAKATFFLTGRWAKNHPELVRTIAGAGHQIENHGYSHPHPDRLSVAANKEEIKKTEKVIESIIGYKTRYYAPPYGEKEKPGVQAASELGYVTVLWTLDTVDWRPESTPEIIAQRIVNPAVRFGVKPDKRGAIVLMHPKENTVKALPMILKSLQGQGFQFNRLEQLITLNQAGNTTS